MQLTIGIEPDLKLAERLTFIQEDLGKIIESRQARVRWTPPEWLYFPIRQLGFLEDSDIPEVCRAIDNAVRTCRPFTISTEGIAAVPSPQCPRIISVALRQGLDEVSSLCNALETSFEMSYLRGHFHTSSPQIMLGRISTPSARIDLGDCISAIGDLNFGLSNITEVILYGAELLYSGPEYSVVSRHRLGT